MKKLKLLFITLFILIMPFMVDAEEKNCEKVNTNNEKTVEIKVKLNFLNKADIPQDEIEKASFNFKILDLDNNTLAETTNDGENVVFDCFTVSVNDLSQFQRFDDTAIKQDYFYAYVLNRYGFDQYRIYKIVMEPKGDNSFDIDSATIYFSLKSNYTNGLFDPIVSYFKDDGDDSPERYGTTYKRKVFHATEEELQGQAYAVLDKNTGILTFFRDEPNKYTNKQEIDNKIYYTGFEEKEEFSEWCYNRYIKEIIFKDAIRPKGIELWFSYLYNLEKADISKLDTSQITSLDYFFSDCKKLKELDISTMDVRNVTSMFKSLYMLDVEYIDLTAWELNQNLTRFQMGEMVSSMPRLKYLNISNLGDWSSSAEFNDIPCLEKLVINNVYDFRNTSSRFNGSNDNTITPEWYNSEKKQLYNTYQIHYNLYNDIDDMAGYYIRPKCTTSASFNTRYIPSEIDNNVLENPNTDSQLIILIIFSIIVLCVEASIFNYKKSI